MLYLNLRTKLLKATIMSLMLFSITSCVQSSRNLLYSSEEVKAAQKASIPLKPIVLKVGDHRFLSEYTRGIIALRAKPSYTTNDESVVKLRGGATFSQIYTFIEAVSPGRTKVYLADSDNADSKVSDSGYKYMPEFEVIVTEQ